MVRDGSLIIQNVEENDAGSYMCVASNSEGSETLEIRLTVSAPLNVHVQPTIQTVDLGKSAYLVIIRHRSAEKARLIAMSHHLLVKGKKKDANRRRINNNSAILLQTRDRNFGKSSRLRCTFKNRRDSSYGRTYIVLHNVLRFDRAVINIYRDVCPRLSAERGTKPAPDDAGNESARGGN